MSEQRKLELIYDFLQKLKKVVRIVLCGSAISQSDCRKAGPYQLAYNNLTHSSENSRIGGSPKSSTSKSRKFSRLLTDLRFARVDKWYGDWWSHFCPKKWLIFTEFCQGLSQKVIFFLIFEPILRASFFDKMLALSYKKSTFVLAFWLLHFHSFIQILLNGRFLTKKAPELPKWLYLMLNYANLWKTLAFLVKGMLYQGLKVKKLNPGNSITFRILSL